MEPINKKFNKIVIWGLKKKYHTHRYIHKAFYENAKKLGYDVIWVEDEEKNAKLIKPSDLIISAEVIGKMVPEKIKIEDYNLPIRKDVYYCLHNYKDIFKSNLDFNHLLNLQVYTTLEAEESDVKLGPVTYFNTKSRTLYQPWGTDLLSKEFKRPVFNQNKLIFWIGSIWNDRNNHGNLEQIADLKRVILKNKLRFIHLRFIPDYLNRFFIRISRIAPAIAGRHQVNVNYLPCRMFKNISYGQLGFSNVEKFNDIFKSSNIYDANMEKMIGLILSLNKEEYLNIIKEQQEICKNYTYEQSLSNIFNCFNN
jgi:hypothetical protein